MVFVTVRDFKVFATESDKVGSPKCVATAAMLVVINVVALATISKPYATRGGYLFSSGSIFGSFYNRNQSQGNGLVMRANVDDLIARRVIVIDRDLDVVLVSLHLIEGAASRVHLLGLLDRCFPLRPAP